MSQPIYMKLLDIAQTHINSRIPTLKSRNNDGLDFYEVSVWNLEAALTAAYELGFKDRSEGQ
jgi:hypothetical protein